MPTTIEGTPFRMSAAKRAARERRFFGYSDRKTAQEIPTGTASAPARPSRISVPIIALAMPPPASPTGFGMLVKNSQLRAGRPRLSTK